MKNKNLLLLALFLCLFLVSSLALYNKNMYKDAYAYLKVKLFKSINKDIVHLKLKPDNLADKSKEAYQFIQNNGYDTIHTILIDYSIHSGKNRFYVWDYNGNKAIIKGLVAHGYGNENFRSTQEKIVFSNVPNSYTSSLGKYKIGVRAPSQWGTKIHYKMHGLEKSNNNAFSRIIVLHSYSKMPDHEIYPEHIPLGYSQGCPVIDNKTMKKMDSLLKNKIKPVLLWIYN